MPPVQAAESGTHRPYAKTAGTEPLPGYRLLAPLGRGGFGEVWKCEAPGGLHKAIKFVSSESDDGQGGQRFGQELAAFEQIKAIRHPFLLTLERVELLGGELVMVMELADRQLQDRFTECRNCGLPGIPRDELLAYFADAAEALDIIAAKHNLQHLDIKPANLFLVSGHVKVGDYGLVAQLEGPDAGNRGLTPRYVAPEVLHGHPSTCSDQYSLALVYQELLTGRFPYPGRTPQQLMLQHVSAQPDLSPLPPADQPAVARALAKQPGDRFPSCLAFVQSLMSAENATALPNASMSIRRARVDRSVAEMNLGDHPDYDPDHDPNAHTPAAPTHPSPGARGKPAPATQNFTLPSKPPLTLPGTKRGALPPLVSGNARAPQTRADWPQSVIATPPPALIATPPPADEVECGLVVLDAIRPVVPVARLLGQEAPEPELDLPGFAEA
ncbi:MAG: serine/threonine protein kinase, partial [Gemmataceae bacterium]|nr:serine/threonine protein kinase [Gemmataceae bacterium]